MAWPLKESFDKKLSECTKIKSEETQNTLTIRSKEVPQVCLNLNQPSYYEVMI